MIDNEILSKIIDYNISRRYAYTHCLDFTENIEFERILKARYNKISRIKQHFVFLITHSRYYYFLTFTFDDDLITKTDRTKRDYIKNSLHSFDINIKYILNIDFGSTTEREHFHCIVGTNNSSSLDEHLKKQYPCFFYCEPIRIQTDDFKRLSKYINKLSNHCCKDSTKNRRIVYSFKSYESIPAPLGRYLYILDSYNLGL